MSTIYRIIVFLVLAILIASCAAPGIATPSPSVLPEIKIARHPKPFNYSGLNVYPDRIPTYDPDSKDSWQVNLQSSDLSKLDLSKSKEDLLYAAFDSQTKWPPADKTPSDFDWQKIMELGKDPGLGIRVLHSRGITGRGVSIAMIDQPLLVDHQEYKDRLRLYEEISALPDSQAMEHASAVASIAVGKTVGVAPEADLYYIGSWTGDYDLSTHDFTWNFSYYAQAVYRILEINRSLPNDHKIRVITMQVGWMPDLKGYAEITAAVKEAREAGIFVISSILGLTHNLYFQGLGRNPLDDPDRFESYVPGLWWEKDFYAGMIFDRPPRYPPKGTSLLLVPMDSRTTASPIGTDDYVFSRQGGLSWSIPYLGGMYALAVQVKPDITPEEFWETALKTGRTIQLQHDGKDYEFGVILDPQTLIEAIKNK